MTNMVSQIASTISAVPMSSTEYFWMTFTYYSSTAGWMVSIVLAMASLFCGDGKSLLTFLGLGILCFGLSMASRSMLGMLGVY